MRKPTQRIASLLPEFRHLLSGSQAYFDRANQLGDIVGMNFFSGSAVETPEDSVQMIGTTLRHSFA